MNNKQFQMKNAILALAIGAVLGTVPALASAATEVTWGGDIIIRPFHRENARDFQESATDTKNFTTERARLKADIKVDENIGGTVELLHFRKWGASDPNRNVDGGGTTNCFDVTTGLACTAATLATNKVTNGNTNTIDDNWLDLNQAYIEVRNLFDTPLYLRAGRQEMAYGDQRLVGNTNFWSTYPFPRAYDAVKVGVKNDAYDIDAWMAKVTERQLSGLFGSTTAPNAAGVATNVPSDRNFGGIWATLKTLIPDNTLDLYVLSMTDGGYTGTALGTYEGTAVAPNFGHFPYVANKVGGVAVAFTDSTRVYNWGTRLKGKYSALDYTVELNHQTGQFADTQSISANGYAAVVGYTIPEAMGLRISAESVYASGDSSPTTGDHTTFYQFTPSPHMHLGAQDFIANQNIRAARIGASFNAKQNLKLSADFWNFKLADANDSWYSSNATSTRGSSAGFAAQGAEGKLADRHIGTELDLVAKYEYSKPLSLELGYSAFNPGSGIKYAPNLVNAAGQVLVGHASGAADRATFAWGMLMLKF